MGQLGAWYVMAAMGLFDVKGGAELQPTFQLGSPLFDRIEIRLSPVNAVGRRFVIETQNNGPDAYYIQEATLNGQPLSSPMIPREEVYRGCRLRLVMGNTPMEQ